MDWLTELNQRVIACRRCPRLVDHCAQVAREKKREFRSGSYWGRPVPGFGDPQAQVLIVGLAPGAHGANRTGRMFTGDQSGRWLYRALHKARFANQPSWERADDGLALAGCYITAAARCAPPDNKPLPDELEACSPYLLEELDRLDRLRVVVALGRIAFAAYLAARRRRGEVVSRPQPRFAHGATYHWGSAGPVLIASYHPSRQNTNTGRLTEPMLDAVFAQVRRLLANGDPESFRDVLSR